MIPATPRRNHIDKVTAFSSLGTRTAAEFRGCDWQMLPPSENLSTLFKDATRLDGCPPLRRLFLRLIS